MECFLREYAFKNVVCKITAILFNPQYVYSVGRLIYIPIPGKTVLTEY